MIDEAAAERWIGKTGGRRQYSGAGPAAVLSVRKSGPRSRRIRCYRAGCLCGAFAPYTNIPTNILFFDRSGPTKDVWYYEHPLPNGKKNYTKTAPIQFEEFAPCIAWWKKREENDRAWKVPAVELLAAGCNLDRKNPRAKEDITHLPPDKLAASILKKEQRIAGIMENIRGLSDV